MSVQTLAWTVLVVQLFLIALISLAWWLLGSGVAAYSALVGGGIYWVPQLLYSWIGSARKADDLNVGLVLWDIYCGAGAKLVATLVLFGVTFKFLEVQHVPMFVTYGLALCSQWIISLTLNNRY
ncbi:ATP synthase subunit I [Pseudaeromonas sharmana]|uniref:ATP synthase subunit I n=1 Tax=Pseudaeromonas sharmana TaxID=328412 RepID=A0ABV8CM56_9GAMM